MNSRQKEVLEQSLKDEQAVLDALVDNYTKALADIKKNIRELQANPLTQSKAYQLEFQKQLEQQISGILDNLQGKNFSSIAGYLQTCYETGFVGTAYDWQGQGVPLVIPIDEGQVIKAVEKTGDDFKLSNKLGVSTKELKQQVKTELQRGLATQLSYAEIARNISDYGQSNMNRSMLIARTEGHRVQSEARMDAMKAAKKKGADIVKQWDATLDGNTRQHHRELDGQIRELDEPFEVAGMKVECPGDFGIAAEDCNCRCCVLQRARWAVEKVDPDTGELTEGKYQKWNNETGGFIETTGYQDFKDRYLKEAEKIKPKTPALKTSQNSGTTKALSECKTASEVETLMKSQKWFNVQTIGNQTYDTNTLLSLSGCDVESAKAVFEACQTVFDKFPQLIGKLNSVGTSTLGGSTYAQCHIGLGHGGVTINKTFFQNAEKLARSYASDIAAGFHPVGTTYKSIVVHEFGHAVDDYLTNTLQASGMLSAWKPKWVSADLRPKVMKSCGKKVSDVRTEVSGYATKDHYEWFAECFAEYLDSPTPRAVASEFGKQLEVILKGVV